MMRPDTKTSQAHRGVASSETAREINRDILLHAIHLHQPVSRADLARLTGLQPSTVSVIIGQLIDEGWVLPGTLGRLPRGRRPTFVTLNDRHVALAIDLRHVSVYGFSTGFTPLTGQSCHNPRSRG